MFSNFEPLRGLEPRTHALRMRNRVLKISELDWRRKNLYRNKTKKIYQDADVDDWGLGLAGLFFRCFLGRGWSEDRDEAEKDKEERIDMED